MVARIFLQNLRNLFKIHSHRPNHPPSPNTMLLSQVEPSWIIQHCIGGRGGQQMTWNFRFFMKIELLRNIMTNIV